MMEATDALRTDKRRLHAERVVHVMLDIFDQYLHPDANRRDLYERLRTLMHNEGAELVTDYTRQELGLPPRGPDGWTAEEIIEMERRHLELLRQPLNLPVLTVHSDPR